MTTPAPDYGQIAYNAYQQATPGQGPGGPWSSANATVQAGWEAAAQAVLAAQPQPPPPPETLAPSSMITMKLGTGN